MIARLNAKAVRFTAAILIAAATVAARADVRISVDPRSSYLYSWEGDPAEAPTVIRLSDYGLKAGDRINLKEFGVFSYGWGFQEVSTDLCGVFSRDGVVLDRSHLTRVPGAIKSGGGFLTSETYNGRQWTDIPEDFAIMPQGTTVVIPSGAQYLVLAVNDSNLSDNYSTRGIGVSISMAGAATGKGHYQLQRLLPTATAAQSGVTALSADGTISGWIGDGSNRKAATMKPGSALAIPGLGYQATAVGQLSATASAATGVGSDGNLHAYLAQGGQVTDLLGGVGNAIATNAKGQVIGTIPDGDGRPFPYVTISGQPQTIFTQWCYGKPTAINAQGDVVGWYIDWDRKLVGWICPKGKTSAQPLNLSADIAAYPTGINDKGQIVGWYTKPNLWFANPAHQAVRSFLLDQSGFHDLGTLPGGTSTEANAINNYGQIVGSAVNGDGETHAFLYANGLMTDLGTLDGNLSEAVAINDQGMIVGNGVSTNGTPTAFVTYAGVGVRSETLSVNYFPEGSTVTATVNLSAPAPAGGLTIGLTSNSSAIAIPTSITVPAGQTSATFAVTANPANGNTPFRITATAGGLSTYVDGTVRSLAIASLNLDRTQTKANTAQTGTIVLEAAALAGGKTITLSSDSAALTFPATVSVPAGRTTVTFPVSVGNSPTGSTLTLFAKCGDRMSRISISVR